MKPLRTFDSMKSLPFWVVGTFGLFFSVLATSAEIKGPEELEPGRIGTFETDLKGSALVFPAGKGDLVQDTGKTRFYFSSTVEDEYTLVFFGVDESSQPVLLQKVFRVESEEEIEPSPEPKPDPKPSPSVKLTDAEKKNLAWCLECTLANINSGKIINAYGARVSFKAYASQAFQSPSEAVKQTLDRWSADSNWETLNDSTVSLKKFLAEVKPPEKITDCPTGTCPWN